MKSEPRTIETATFTNPFTGKDQRFYVDGIILLLDEAELEAAKTFIRKKLGEALINQEIVLEEFYKTKVQYLMVQMYQPNSFVQLYDKLEKYREYLYGRVEEFDQVYNHYNSIRGFYIKNVSSLAKPVICGNCNSVYAVPEDPTIDQAIFYQCPYCKSKNWTDAPAGAKYFKNQK